MCAESDVLAMYPKIAELAMQSSDQQTFRQEWLSLLATNLGFDSADICSTSDGCTFATHTVNADARPLQRGVAEHMSEMQEAELSLLLRGRSMFGDEVFSASRRDRLRAYRELLIPRGVVTYATRAWMRAGRIFFIFMCNHRRTGSATHDVLRAIDSIVPIVAIGEALHAERRSHGAARALREFGAVTRSEAGVASLAQRGLTNIEISALTGTRPATIRNQLSSAYRKLGVKNRTELAFLLSHSAASQERPTSQSAVAQLLQTEGGRRDRGLYESSEGATLAPHDRTVMDGTIVSQRARPFRSQPKP